MQRGNYRMPFILIKNNLKLMLRSKWILVLMIILPLITISLLANAFREMMDTDYSIEEFQVGYRLEDNSIYKDMIPGLQTLCKDNDVILQEYPNGDIKKLLQDETVEVFVEIKDDTYVLYQSNKYKAEAAVTESIFSGFFYKVNEAMTAQSYTAGQGVQQETVNAANQEGHKMIKEVLDTDPVPSSTDYYGIIYIVYFAWCGMISLVAVISSERKNAIPRRMRVSHLPKWNYYVGKLIPCTLAIFFEVCTAWILSVLLFDIHWGNITIALFIIFLISVAASVFGIVLFQLFKNVAISIVTGFIIIWIAGFFGGSFQTYIYAALPQKLVNMSPIYYVNRTLVEFSTKGGSDYTGKCIGFLLGIIFVCGILGILLMNRKMEEQ
jgi:ABC-2 type transport system permease protein